MKTKLQYMIETTTKFFALMGMDNKVTLSDESEESVEIFVQGHVIALDKTTNVYYLLAIQHFFGTREEPPHDDYKEIFDSNNLIDVLKMLALEITNQAIETIKFDEQFEQENI